MATSSALNSTAAALKWDGGEKATIAALAQKLEVPELSAKFDALVAAEQGSAVFNLPGRDGELRVQLSRLDGAPPERLILVELDEQVGGSEQKFLLEVGRATKQLVHDFKNQISGLMVYAAYLKKRFADQPEVVETAEKINRGLKNMAEHAGLVSRLAQPINLTRKLTDVGEFLKQAIVDYQVLAAARGVKIEDQIEDLLSAVAIDATQLRAALGSIITRAIDISPAGGVVSIRLQSQAAESGGLQIEVGDEGEILSEQQRETLFDFLTGKHISSTSLNMALARHIIEQHGGQVSALAASKAGTVVQMKLPI